VWAAALGGAALLASRADRNAVDLALGIASITYGGVLGIFLLGRFTSVSGFPAVCGFLGGTAFSAFLYFGEIPGIGTVFWPWFVPAGALVTVAVAIALSLLAARRRRDGP
jgi:hypothetical protein